jgi:predicted HicB family RNase H-like nuclease
MPAQTKPKPKKPGRPRMAKSEAKGSIVPVRFSPEERKRVEAAAKASKQTVSAWVRSTLAAAIGG